MLQTTWQCDICGNRADGKTDETYSSAPSDSPEGWATINVTQPNRVVPKEMRDMVDQISGLSGALGPVLSTLTTNFQTSAHVCPKCQTGAFWDFVSKRRDEAENKPAVNVPKTKLAPLLRIVPPTEDS
jgi:ribosomal protein L37AE/L43A